MTSVSRKAFEICLRGFQQSVQNLGKKGNLILAELAEKLAPTIEITLESGSLKMYCPGRAPVWCADSFFLKNPKQLSGLIRLKIVQCFGILVPTLEYFHFTPLYDIK
jgi:hypothetical protein